MAKNKVTKIPTGYRLTVVSWENDGDNYNTEVLEGLPREQCQYYVALCKLLLSNIGTSNPYNNLYDPSSEEIEKLTKALTEIALEHASVVTEIDDFNDGEVVRDYVHEDLYTLGLTCGEFYTRVCESYTVEYVPQEILLEDVTEEF